MARWEIAILLVVSFAGYSGARLHRHHHGHHRKHMSSPVVHSPEAKEIFSKLSTLVKEVDLGLDKVYDAIMEDRNSDAAMSAVKLRLSKAWVLTGELEAIGGKELVASADSLMSALREAAKELNVMIEDAKNKPALSEDLEALLKAQEDRQEEQVLELIRRAEILVSLHNELNQQTQFLKTVSNDSTPLPPVEAPPSVIDALFAMQEHLQGQSAHAPLSASMPAAASPKTSAPANHTDESGHADYAPPAAGVSKDVPTSAASAPPADVSQADGGTVSGVRDDTEEGDEAIDFKKLGHILQSTPVLTEASKHLAGQMWETKKNEEEFSKLAANVPVSNQLPLAYYERPNPDALGFMPPGVDKELGLTDGLLENSGEVRLGGAPVKAPKPHSKHGHSRHALGRHANARHHSAGAHAIPAVAATAAAKVNSGAATTPTNSGAAAAPENGGAAAESGVEGDDGEPIDFRKIGHIMQKTPVLTEAAKHLASKTWETKERESEFSQDASDIPVSNYLPLAYHGRPNPDALGFMPPGVDKELGLTDGILENSGEVRMGSTPVPLGHDKKPEAGTPETEAPHVTTAAHRLTDDLAHHDVRAKQAGESLTNSETIPIDFKKIGHVMQNSPVLTEAAKHFGSTTWENKAREEDLGAAAAEIPVSPYLPLAGEKVPVSALSK